VWKRRRRRCNQILRLAVATAPEPEQSQRQQAQVTRRIGQYVGTWCGRVLGVFGDKAGEGAGWGWIWRWRLLIIDVIMFRLEGEKGKKKTERVRRKRAGGRAGEWTEVGSGEWQGSGCPKVPRPPCANGDTAPRLSQEAESAERRAWRNCWLAPRRGMKREWCSMRWIQHELALSSPDCPLTSSLWLARFPCRSLDAGARPMGAGDGVRLPDIVGQRVKTRDPRGTTEQGSS
jgi:hypothetical protein